MVEPTPKLAGFQELVRTLLCNRITPHNQSTSLQIRAVEVSAARARDRPHAQTVHRRRRARSNDCPPNALWPAAASLGGCAARFLKRAPPAQARLQREKAPSGWCHQLRCDRAVDYEINFIFVRYVCRYSIVSL